MRRYLRTHGIYSVLVAALSVVGCGSSGNDNSQQQVTSSSVSQSVPQYEMSITFPVDGSLTGGGESSFRVKGTVVMETGEAVALNGGEISVNGVTAEINEASTGEWYADIPLEFGENTVTATFSSDNVQATTSITLDNGLVRSYMSERRFNGQVYGTSSVSLDLYRLDNGTPTLDGIPALLLETLASCNRIAAFEPVTENQALIICDTTDSFYVENTFTHLYDASSESIINVSINRFDLSSGRVVFISDDVIAQTNDPHILSIERLSTDESIAIPTEQFASADGATIDFTEIFEGAIASGKLHLWTNRGSITVDVSDLLLALQQGYLADSIFYTEISLFSFPYNSVIAGDLACEVDYFDATDGVYPMICYNLITGDAQTVASSNVGTGPIWQVGLQFTGRNNSAYLGSISKLDDTTVRVAGLQGDGIYEVDLETLTRTELAPSGVVVGALHETDQAGVYLSYSTAKGIATEVNINEFTVTRITAPRGRNDVKSHGTPFTRALPSLSGDSVLHLNNHDFTGTSEPGYPLITEVHLASDDVSTAVYVDDIALMLGHDLGTYRYRIVEIKAHPVSGYIIALAAISADNTVAPFEGLYHLSESFDSLMPLNVNNNYVAGDTPEAQPISNIEPESGRLVVSSFNDGSVSLLAAPYDERIELLPPGDPYRFVFYPFVDWKRNRLVATGYPVMETSDTPDFSRPSIFTLDLTTNAITDFSGRGLSLGFTEMSSVSELGLYQLMGSPYELGPSLVLMDPDSGDSIIKPLTIQ